MSVTRAISRFRRNINAAMTSTVTVKRGGTGGTFNDATLTYTSAAGTTVYTGPALVRPMQGSSRGEDGAVVTEQFDVKFPANTDVIRGDSVTVTASTFDTGLVDTTMWVLSTDTDEWQIARVAVCTNQVSEVYP